MKLQIIYLLNMVCQPYYCSSCESVNRENLLKKLKIIIELFLKRELKIAGLLSPHLTFPILKSIGVENHLCIAFP